jgi:hypothetical protein
MINISVKADISRALAKLQSAPKDVMTRAVPRALNRVAAEAKTESSRSIRAAGYKLKAGAIKKQISIRRATRSELKAIVKATGKPIPLIEYAAREVSTGVSVAVKGGRKIIKHAFIATMPTGHKGVYVRVGKGHKKVIKNGKVIWSGLPIKQLYGPSIPAAFSNEVVQDALKLKIKQRFPQLLAHEMAFLGLKR